MSDVLPPDEMRTNLNLYVTDLYRKHVETLDELKKVYLMIERLHKRLCALENQHTSNKHHEEE